MDSVMGGLRPFRRVSPVQILLLLQLNEGPKYGYEMLKNIREEFEGVWEPRTGTIYPALRSLERRGLVETEAKEETEFYHLTEKGEELLKLMGARMRDSIRFTARYTRFVSRWMPRELKNTVIEMITTLAKEDFASYPGLIYLFDETMDSGTRLAVLEDIRSMLAGRLNVVEGLIEQAKEGP